MVSPIIIGLATILLLLYYFVKRQYSYWERHGIPFIKPSIPFGNFKDFGKIHQSEMFQNFYNQMKGTGKFFGIYMFHNPAIVPTDLEFLKNVMIKDFNYFQDRGMYVNERDDPLNGHLFFIEGEKWKNLRTKMTPTFTSGKMKFMYPTILKVADRFRDTINNMLDKNGSVDVEIKELVARFSTDVIGECAFGIECNTLKNPEAEFRVMGRKVFEMPMSVIAKFMLATLFPAVAKYFRLKMMKPDVEHFFMDIVKQTVSYRESKQVKRNDFMDLLINLKNRESVDENGKKLGGLTMNELSAQAFVFFLAGFETSSTLMMFAFYELIINKHIQEKAREEIERTMAKHGGEFTYECVMDMTYIEQILNESLRKHPPVTVLNRSVTKDYKVPNSDIILEKGTPVFVPVYAIHHDPQYYPNPDVFDPDRFTPEEVQKRDSLTFLPFGDGPRNCIGMRFGMMQAKIGLVTLLTNYDLSVCDKTMIPLKISKTDFNLSPEGGIHLNIKKLN